METALSLKNTPRTPLEWASKSTLVHEESARLQEVASYEILDTPDEANFDELTRVCARLCDTPISLLSFVQPERDWRKSVFGPEGVSEYAKQCSPEQSICRVAMRTPEKMLVIPDTDRDERLKGNPLVGKGLFRFYAGQPLVNPRGYPVGVLCVLDTEPRTLSPEQEDMMRLVGELTLAEMELRRESLKDDWRESPTIREALDRLISNCSVIEVRLIARVGSDDPDVDCVRRVREKFLARRRTLLRG